MPPIRPGRGARTRPVKDRPVLTQSREARLQPLDPLARSVDESLGACEMLAAPSANPSGLTDERARTSHRRGAPRGSSRRGGCRRSRSLDACAARIDAVDGLVGAFTALCLERAREEARRVRGGVGERRGARARGRSRSRSRTCSTPRACARRTARRCSTRTSRRATPRRSGGHARPARSSSARRRRTSSRGGSPPSTSCSARRTTRGRSIASRAARAAARRSCSPRARCRSRSAATPAARSASRPRSAASSG